MLGHTGVAGNLHIKLATQLIELGGSQTVLDLGWELYGSKLRSAWRCPVDLNPENFRSLFYLIDRIDNDVRDIVETFQQQLGRDLQVQGVSWCM
ncbi:hypothetical protein EWW49_06360 [Pseudomonas syringae]|nr:hypothetical protein A988_23029 [Pseudomonas syringae BRIP39023]PBP34202.1 hypothetical protein CCL12_11315 [Pseudomonas syringae]PBP38317.1 hypothetical protein CCL13_23755 [Pseudomonas syringae]PBP64971.1 hypothetical protein CCL19_16335 [Pseudomonas syringae]QNR43097.1 hypothetical protein D5S12_17945 [Pseudomonas syringae]